MLFVWLIKIETIDISAECCVTGPESASHVTGCSNQWYGLYGLPAVQHAEHDFSVTRSGPQYAATTAVHAGPAAHVPAGWCFQEFKLHLLYFCLLNLPSLARWLPLVVRSSLCSSSRLRLCRAAKRLSSFPLIENPHAAVTHYTLLSLLCFSGLWCSPAGNTHTPTSPSFHPSCDVVAMWNLVMMMQNFCFFLFFLPTRVGKLQERAP